ncbi:Putative ceramide glucosyltransferase, nucleotide-diphospho-sugar transferase [Septoria linicola]|uniref:Ceramide glucosyltransferase n=1 Tax=Septoria linicola TaxID=215465 RepID=A0A9Q9ARW7_9PEZI|nr:putative ceramide glucosyltransferase, nucleotide-diphospho-sugar transferase [Septoria linicola]USW50901.1 Putative ceramide glucosyltransferase, nucleotide-diphospho-sugar transferase [Septoria linicola]
MPPRDAVVEPTSASSHGQHEHSTITLVAATVCLIWYAVVQLICAIGYSQIWRHYSSPEPPADIDVESAPHVTIIRPVKGLEPRLYQCLASTFRQQYPKDRLHVRFCLADRNDPSYAVVKRLLADFPSYDAQLLLENEDEQLKTPHGLLGPNPKIRNMSRAYREAIGNIIWVIDCNVWVATGVAGRMVAKLEGRGEKQKYKFVHQMPLVIDILGTTKGDETASDESATLLNGNADSHAQIRTTSSASASFQQGFERNASTIGGGRLEEAFMASSHAKFYTAINTVAVAPCIVGKSTMFRKSHLNSLTNDAGIDYFSQNICEDHLIGDLLWKSQVPEEMEGESFGKHGQCFGDLVIQPMANMSVYEYWSRRARWLRVRKFTVPVATLVEPGIEPFLCSLYGAFAATTLPWFERNLGISQSWTAFGALWLASVVTWCLIDWTLYLKLHSGASIEVDEETPFFTRRNKVQRKFGEWILAWIGREALCLPIWLWAVWGGTQVEWRGKKFRVGMDTKVHEIADSRTERSQVSRSASPATSNGKARTD